MQELSEDFLTTDKLLYLRGLDGESQVPLMKELAKIAQEFYDEFPEFCALVPFGSRTKGLSKKENSDTDIIVILDYSSTLDKKGCERRIEQFFSERNLAKTSLRFVDIEEYKHPRTRYSVVDHFMYGIKIGPNRVDSCCLDEETKDAILRSLDNIEELGVRHKDINQKEQFLRNRRRLWKKRISSLLGEKETN